MRHHRFVSRTPLLAQTEYEPGDTSSESKMNFLVAFFTQSMEFVFNKTGGTLR